MSERMGIGVICYYSVAEVVASVASVREHCRADYTLMLFDNSEDDEVGEWARHHAADALYVRSPYNVGCARSRNRLAAIAAGISGMSHLIIQDQDVVWTADAVPPMRAVFARHKDTGIVGWNLANTTMGTPYPPDKTGAIPELPGMMNMYSVECIKAAGAWHSGMLMYLFDSLICLKASKLAGYKTRVVMGSPCAVEHRHPHRGVKRYPWWRDEQARSRAIFRAEVAEHGLSTPAGLGK